MADQEGILTEADVHRILFEREPGQLTLIHVHGVLKHMAAERANDRVIHFDGETIRIVKNENPKHVLLIYNIIPEEVRFYYIHNPTREQVNVLNFGNGAFLNEEMTEKSEMLHDFANKVNCALGKPVSEPEYPEWNGIWHDKRITVARLGVERTPMDRVFYMGAVL